MATMIITGSKGQLGRAILDRATIHPQHRFIGVDIDELDICDEGSLASFIQKKPAQVLINCAAYTAVDQAEDEPGKAYEVNTKGVIHLASICNRFRIKLIHISTDYVFDGESSTPRSEWDITRPMSIYGQSKLDGELGILYHSKDAVIIRTSWLYYHGGKNFINTIIQKAREKKQLQVVYDQVGAPTFAGDLAEAILKIAEENRPQEGVAIYHYANQGVTSWYDLARAITDIMEIECRIEAVETMSLNQKAKRPPYSVLNCRKIMETYQLEIPYWRDSLVKYLQSCH